MTSSFTIHTSGYNGRRRYVVVRMYPDAAGLRAAAHALSPQRGGVAHWDRVYGCFHPAGWPRAVGQPATFPANGFAGTLRLIDPPCLDDEGEMLSFKEIVAHELVHAAVHVYRMNVAPALNLGRRSSQHEEQFAYIYGELAADMHRHLSESSR